MKTIIRFFRDEAAATSIEYAIIAACIAVSFVAAANGLGAGVGREYAVIEASIR